MTRAEQNQLIINKIVEKMTDKPTAISSVSKAFTQWFQALVQAGAQQMVAQQQQQVTPQEEQGQPSAEEEMPQ